MASTTSDMTNEISTTDLPEVTAAATPSEVAPQNALESADESSTDDTALDSTPDDAALTQTGPVTLWRTIRVKPRVDSFNQRELLDQLQKARTDGCLSIALDLKGNRFLSFPVIKTCVEMAREVAEKGGAFALLTYSEKTRRHFEIYGSLDHVLLLKDSTELPPAVDQTTARPPVVAVEAAPRKPSSDND